MTTETLPRTAPLEPRTGTPLEPTTPIRPSEALRLGRLFRPVPVRGGLFRGRDRACAVGAMALGFGLDNPVAGLRTDAERDVVYGFVEDHFPDGTGQHWVEHITGANDCGYSDDDIAASLRAYGL